MRQVKRGGRVWWALVWAPLWWGCGGIEQIEPVGTDSGSITLMFTSAPEDVRCLEVTVQGERTVTKRFDVTPGKAASLSMGGIPVGTVTIHERAFEEKCKDVGPHDVPTWVSEQPVQAAVSATKDTEVKINLVPTGTIDVKNNFDDSTLAVVPSDTDFGGVVVGARSAPVRIGVRNVGRANLGNIAAMIVGPDAADFILTDAPCTSLRAGATCTLEVVFRPVTAGTKQATVRVSSRADAIVVGDLTGRGLAPAGLVWSPSFHDFGAVAPGQRSAVQTFVLRNQGDVPSAAISAIQLIPAAGSTAPFLFAGGTCRMGQVLNPGATCTIDAYAAPTPGEASGVVRTADLTATLAGGATVVATVRFRTP